ncbi:hypothetical protein EHR10_18030 [Leptospira yasudae]|nr:hypothetical protein EHR10_18030 [Leptospira yasudae]
MFGFQKFNFSDREIEPRFSRHLSSTTQTRVGPNFNKKIVVFPTNSILEIRKDSFHSYRSR